MYEAYKKIGIEAIVKAASLCKQVQKDLVQSLKGHIEKKDRSPVTVADYGSQAIICHMLKEAYPHEIVAEEDSSLLQSPENEHLLKKTLEYVEKVVEQKLSHEQLCQWIDYGNGGPCDRFWTLDPIDGTKGFLRGDQYAVALALIVKGKVELGMMACPNLPLDNDESDGYIFVAISGKGAKIVNPAGSRKKALQVSSIDDPALAHFIESVESSHSNHQQHQQILHFLHNETSSARMDSQAKYGLLATGKAEIYLRMPVDKKSGYKEKIWDHAAGSIIVKEAGGQVTDIHGTTLDFSLGKTLQANHGILATNGKFHQEVLEAIKYS